MCAAWERNLDQVGLFPRGQGIDNLLRTPLDRQNDQKIPPSGRFAPQYYAPGKPFYIPVTFPQGFFATFLIRSRVELPFTAVMKSQKLAQMGERMSEGRLEQLVAKEFQDSLEAVVTRYEGKAFALYELLVPGGEGSVECLAQAFASSLNAFESGVEEVSLEVLLYREVIRTAVEFLRASSSVIPEESSWQPSVFNSPRMASPQVAPKVDSAVHSLPIEYRVVFSLRDVLRLQTEMVQDILSITELEIRAYLHRARLMLFRVMRGAQA